MQQNTGEEGRAGRAPGSRQSACRQCDPCKEPRVELLEAWLEIRWRRSQTQTSKKAVLLVLCCLTSASNQSMVCNLRSTSGCCCCSTVLSQRSRHPPAFMVVVDGCWLTNKPTNQPTTHPITHQPTNQPIRHKPCSKSRRRWLRSQKNWVG